MLQEVITAEGAGEGRGYTAFQMCLCGKGHAFGDIYSTWLHCKGFLAPGAFLFSSPSSWPYQLSACRGSEVSVREGHLATGCCGLEGKTGSHSCKAIGLMKVS